MRLPLQHGADRLRLSTSWEVRDRQRMLVTYTVEIMREEQLKRLVCRVPRRRDFNNIPSISLDERVVASRETAPHFRFAQSSRSPGKWTKGREIIGSSRWRPARDNKTRDDSRTSDRFLSRSRPGKSVDVLDEESPIALIINRTRRRSRTTYSSPVFRRKAVFFLP